MKPTTIQQVKAGADVGERDAPGGYTPLHLAADAGQADAVGALAALGAPLEARSAKGLTPLALATFKARPPGRPMAHMQQGVSTGF